MGTEGQRFDDGPAMTFRDQVGLWLEYRGANDGGTARDKALRFNSPSLYGAAWNLRQRDTRSAEWQYLERTPEPSASPAPMALARVTAGLTAFVAYPAFALVRW